MWRILILGSLLCFSCKNGKETTADGKQPDENNIHIWVSSTRKICGGARPTPDEEKDARTPKSFANKTLYLKRGTVNHFDNPVIDSLTSNSEGYINIRLKPGNYILVDENKKNKAAYDAYIAKYKNSMYHSPVDEVCYKKHFEQADLAFSAPTDSTLYLNYHKRCSWDARCTNYSGPYPP